VSKFKNGAGKLLAKTWLITWQCFCIHKIKITQDKTSATPCHRRFYKPRPWHNDSWFRWPPAERLSAEAGPSVWRADKPQSTNFQAL